MLLMTPGLMIDIKLFSLANHQVRNQPTSHAFVAMKKARQESRPVKDQCWKEIRQYCH